MGAREDDLRPLGGHLDFGNIGAHPVRLAIVLTRNLLTVRQQCFGATEVDDQVAPLVTPDDSVDHFADPVFKLIVDPFALGFTDLLNNHLLGGLGSNPAEAASLHHHPEGVADFDFGVDFTRLFDIDLLVGVNNLVDHGDELEDLNFTDLFVEMCL